MTRYELEAHLREEKAYSKKMRDHLIERTDELRAEIQNLRQELQASNETIDMLYERANRFGKQADAYEKERDEARKRLESVTRVCQGLQPPNEDDAKKVEEALANYRIKHPNAVAGFCECYACSGCSKTPPVHHDPNADGNLVRLEWLAFWVRLAVETCEHPAIYNN